MMMQISEFKSYLQSQFSGTKFYAGAIDKSQEKCIGVYPRGSATPNIALGGKQNTSYGKLPFSIVVHWTQSSEQCERKANEIYEHLYGASNFTISGRRIISIELSSPAPMDLSRDDNNICEMLIAGIIYYEREVESNEA